MSAYVALAERDLQDNDELQARLLQDRLPSEYERVGRDRAGPENAGPRSDIRSRSGFVGTVKSLAISTMVIAITILLFAFAAIPSPKLSSLRSIIVVAVFGTLMMMAVAVVILVHDDQVEEWAPNLLFFVLCALFFTVPIAFIALVHSDQELLLTKWNAEKPERRSHLTEQLNHLRRSSALNEEQAGLVIVAEGATILLQFSIVCWVLTAIEIAMSFPLYMMQFADGSAGDRLPPDLAVTVTRQLQAAGLL